MDWEMLAVCVNCQFSCGWLYHVCAIVGIYLLGLCKSWPFSVFWLKSSEVHRPVLSTTSPHPFGAENTRHCAGLAVCPLATSSLFSLLDLRMRVGVSHDLQECDPTFLFPLHRELYAGALLV